MMEQGRFVKLLAELLELAAVKDNRIVKAEVDQWFEELSLNREQLALVYRYLEENQVRISGLEKADRLYGAGIAMNGQIVLCKGVNDGKELEYSIRKLIEYAPLLKSVSVVPVGLSKFREGLYPLEPFDRADAKAVLEMIHGFQKECMEKFGLHFVHASDEWYILAGEDLPEEESYDGYLQLENGVGMLRLMLNEFEEGYRELQERLRAKEIAKCPEELSIATGKLAYPYISRMAKALMNLLPDLHIMVYAIVNEFFGEMITVSGLLTGRDMINQLKGKELGERLLLPENVLRSGEDVFLDDVTVGEMEKALQVKVDIVKSSGYEFVQTIIKDR